MPEYPWIIYRMSEGPLTTKEVHQGVNEQLNRKLGTDWGYSEYEWANLLQGFRPLPIRTASGTIAHFEDGADSVPMKSVVANIVPVQEGTGTPSPSNPRPISGTDELTLKHDNDNMLSLPTFDFTIQGVRVYTNEDGNVVLNGTSTGGISSDNALWTNNLRFSLPKGHYYLSCNSFSTYGAVVVVKNTDTNATICQFDSNWQVDLTETTPMRIGIYIPAGKTFDNFVCNFEASLDNITYDVPNRETYTFDLGQEIIGGTADVVGGVGSKTMAEIDLGDLSWTKQTMQNGSGFTARIEDGEPIGNVNSSGALCEIYPEDISVQNPYYIADETFKYGGTYFGKRNVTILDSTKENMTASEFKTAMTGIKFAYPLETPTDFTFTGQPINSYLGVNNVWTDSGNTKVTYKYKTGEGGSTKKKYLPIFYDFYGKGCRHL